MLAALGLFLSAKAVVAQRPALGAVPVVLPAPVASAAALPAPDITLSDAMRSLASRAGVVFVGQVTSIERKGGIVEVHFSIQQTVQGSVAAGYALREWAGLWPQGEQRYVLGQRALFFLHPASAAGLSSPIDGMEGIVPLVPVGADVPPLLDVRRLAARLRRNVGQPLVAEAITLADAVSVIQNGASTSEPLPRWLPITSHPNGQTTAQ